MKIENQIALSERISSHCRIEELYSQSSHIDRIDSFESSHSSAKAEIGGLRLGFSTRFAEEIQYPCIWRQTTTKESFRTGIKKKEKRLAPHCCTALQSRLQIRILFKIIIPSFVGPNKIMQDPYFRLYTLTLCDDRLSKTQQVIFKIHVLENVINNVCFFDSQNNLVYDVTIPTAVFRM